MADPIPVWEDNGDSEEDTETASETEEEEDEVDESNEDHSKENTDEENKNWLKKFLTEGYEGTPTEIPPQEGLDTFEEKDKNNRKEEGTNITKHSHRFDPSIEKEENGLYSTRKIETESKEKFEEIDFKRQEENLYEINDSDEKGKDLNEFSKFPNDKDQEDENDITDHSEDTDTFEEEEKEYEKDLNLDEVTFEYPQKPIQEEEKPDFTESEYLEIFDGKEGTPDPYAFAPLDISDGVQIGDERWKAMMEQIMYTSPYEDYVPHETKPPHEVIWEMWDRTDFNEGRYVDEAEFDDHSMPSDFNMEFEELKKVAKLLQEGKPVPYGY